MPAADGLFLVTPCPVPEDRACSDEPLDTVTGALARPEGAVEGDRAPPSSLECLVRGFWELVEDLSERDEARHLYRSVVEAMKRDRERVLHHEVLNRDELLEQHRTTFRHSLDIVLVCLGRELRARDFESLLDLFGWCSTMRDLEEDLRNSLCNVPAEILRQAGVAVTQPPTRADYLSLLSTPTIRDWALSEREIAAQLIQDCDARLREIGSRPGAEVFRISLKSMRGSYVSRKNLKWGEARA